ncbi:MAG: hypothetical protein ACFFG0_51185 [Candidatus Thorarchaeota archaeon]
MPELRAHCKISRDRTSEEFEDLHRWIDNPPEAKILGVNHRIKRHAYKVEDEEYIKNIWGEKGVIEWLFHVAIDNIHTAYKLAKKYYGVKAFNFIQIGINPDTNFIYVDHDRVSKRDLSDIFND